MGPSVPEGSMSADKRSGYINVDELMPKVTVEQVAAFYGANLPVLNRGGVGGDSRMPVMSASSVELLRRVVGAKE